MNHIAPQSRSLFDDWTFARPMILAAIKNMHGLSENDVLAGLLAGQFRLHLGTKSAIMTQNESFQSGGMALNFYAAGGDKTELLEMEAALCKDAGAAGYRTATARGRKGWEKEAAKRGWKFDYIAMYKELG